MIDGWLESNRYQHLSLPGNTQWCSPHEISKHDTFIAQRGGKPDDLSLVCQHVIDVDERTNAAGTAFCLQAAEKASLQTGSPSRSEYLYETVFGLCRHVATESY